LVDEMRTRVRLILLVTALVSVSACSGSSEAPAEATASARGGTPSGSPAPSAVRPRIVVLGDSLTAGLGLAPEESFPHLLQQRADAEGLGFEVVNAGVSGDTSAGGLRRVAWVLDGEVRILLVALGGNDGLRGVPPAELRRNLAGIIEEAQRRGVAVVLAGMEAPPNFGETYTREFRAVYTDLAATYRVPLIPFLLQGVAGVDALNQPDGIHPTAAGARQIANTVWPALRDAVRTAPPSAGREGSPGS
jgi:acyl-CoA thioesterase-1